MGHGSTNSYRRPSRTGALRRDLPVVVLGESYAGRVTGIAECGIFVTLDASWDAQSGVQAFGLVHHKNLAVGAGALFSKGQRVRATVLQIREGQRLALRLETSFTNQVNADVRPKNTPAPAIVGDVKHGTIAKVHERDDGVFVKLDGSPPFARWGWAHISEIADERVDKPRLSVLFPVNKRVKVKVLRIDDRGLCLGLKPSYFAEDAAAKAAEEETAATKATEEEAARVEAAEEEAARVEAAAAAEAEAAASRFAAAIDASKEFAAKKKKATQELEHLKELGSRWVYGGLLAHDDYQTIALASRRSARDDAIDDELRAAALPIAAAARKIQGLARRVAAKVEAAGDSPRRRAATRGARRRPPSPRSPLRVRFGLRRRV